ncbi:cytochrome P450 4C1-like [Lycorma delicatula]|uniref:cytochrome P450 4C1-like n=1 Tax=Lycorma delicatula TaxID=130591 RepID=UPI003F517378
MFGGHDTTTSAVGFALHLLMKHPKVQDKVVEELNQIFGDSNRPATFHDLKNMKYLKRVIQETLRMYTSIPIIFRQITEDVQLSSYILPKGSTVCLFLHKLHYDPKLFPEPDVFNPDRFLPDVVKSRHPYAYCPFSAGSRNCIGQRFGMLEIKVIISGILRKFKILPPLADCPDIILGLDAVLRSLTGIHVRLENR